MAEVDYTPNSSNHRQCFLNLNRFRELVQWYIDKHQYASALFWADKVVSLSKGETADVYSLAQCLYLTRQYHRAASCIKKRDLHKNDLKCRFLAVSSHYVGKEYKEALELLELPLPEPKFPEHGEPLPMEEVRRLESSLQLLKGRVYEAMDNRSLATECYRTAIQLDVFCYEAFQALIQHQMLSKDEERDILNSLPFSQVCNKEESNLITLLYETQLKKYDKPSSLTLSSELNDLKENLDIATALAERCYYNCDYRQCYQITSVVLQKDPYHNSCLPIHISCLMELHKSNDLFHLAHKLVDLYPDSAIAWFAVGCYYFLINRADAARRFLSKATVLDQVFGPAWLVYGHSFAVENEHDQAMAAYFKASQLMKGCHLPLLYIGLEYGLTNNTKLAERFFTQALTISPKDPFVLHELGVVAFQCQDFNNALKYFETALQLVQNRDHTVLPEKWEPLLNNLGHTCRKLRRFEEALEFHQKALILSPQNPSTYSAIGFVHSLMYHWSQAVEYFHKALGLQRDDTFSTTMLTHMIEHLMNEIPPCVDVPDELPSYISSSQVNLQEVDLTQDLSQSGEVEMEGNG